MHVPALDKNLGMSVYATDSDGLEGAIRRSPEDFLVEEVLVDGSIASIYKKIEPALGASESKQHFLLCVLVKRNWDTFVALKNIAKQLSIDQARISIAGIKDAKAITSQYFTIENMTAESIAKIKIKDVEVRPVGYFRDKLSSFYLMGNRFTITIKEVKHPKLVATQKISGTIGELDKKGGFPNFFGHQRFGTTRAITHLVGRAIVNSNFQEAAMLFLAKPSPFEHHESRAAREELHISQDFVQAFHNYPKQLRFERLMLWHLAKKPEDFIGALKQLPFKLQMLFVQAYQAYIFNRFLSERIKKGLCLNKAEIGDHIVNVDRFGLPMPKTGRLVTENTLSETNASIKAGRMRIALPLVGFRQDLSGGEMRQIETNILKEENVNLDCFRIQDIPRLSAQGELRSIIAPVCNFKMEEIDSNEISKLQKIKLSFMLLRGSYATLLLREIMKPQDPLKAGF